MKKTMKKTKKNKEDNEDNEEDNEDKGSSGQTKLALADKGYRGLPLLYIPFQKQKRKFTRTEKKWNKELSSIRAIVENIQRRLKEFDVIGTKYRVRKYNKKNRIF